jgi:hypothetical protein
MSSTYDMIKKKDIIDAPETVNSTWTSPSFSLDDRFGQLFISMRYENGVDVEMSVYLQLSDDNQDSTFATVVESLQPITAADGSVSYDLDGTGAPYARILIEVTSGSIDVTRIRMTAGQFH